MGLWGSIRKAAKRYGRVAVGVATGGASELVYGIKEARKAQDSAENEAAAEEAKLRSKKRAATAAEYAALEDARKKRARVRGRQSTILAGALGDTLPNFGQRSLLGV